MTLSLSFNFFICKLRLLILPYRLLRLHTLNKHTHSVNANQLFLLILGVRNYAKHCGENEDIMFALKKFTVQKIKHNSRVSIGQYSMQSAPELEIHFIHLLFLTKHSLSIIFRAHSQLSIYYFKMKHLFLIFNKYFCLLFQF